MKIFLSIVLFCLIIMSVWTSVLYAEGMSGEKPPQEESLSSTEETGKTPDQETEKEIPPGQEISREKRIAAIEQRFSEMRKNLPFGHSHKSVANFFFAQIFKDRFFFRGFGLQFYFKLFNLG